MAVGMPFDLCTFDVSFFKCKIQATSLPRFETLEESALKFYALT